jgi:hypothetical protein
LYVTLLLLKEKELEDEVTLFHLTLNPSPAGEGPI